MSDKDKEKIVQEELDVSEMTSEQRAAAWMEWVRSEVNAALDIYLPVSKNGNVNVKYVPHKVEELDTGPVYTDSKADGVLLSLLFEFEEPVEIIKSEDEEKSE